MAFCRLSGIDLTMDFLSFVTVMMMLIRPQMKTMARAWRQVKPPAAQTVKAKRALSPIPGATA